MNTILVIDDNKDYRADLLEILTFENYATLEAEDGHTGLQMIRRHSPNLILCDIDMPVMNGIEVLRNVKADPTYANIPIIVVTGSSDPQTLKTARDSGADSLLTKPINIANYLAIIGNFLSRVAPTAPSA